MPPSAPRRDDGGKHAGLAISGEHGFRRLDALFCRFPALGYGHPSPSLHFVNIKHCRLSLMVFGKVRKP